MVQEGNYTATVEPELINNISASAPNRIKEIYVDEGIRVSKGQKLALLDDVNTSTYETQVANAKANLENVQINYDRAVELLKIGGGTQQNVDQMQLQLTNAKTLWLQQSAHSATSKKTRCSFLRSTGLSLHATTTRAT